MIDIHVLYSAWSSHTLWQLSGRDDQDSITFSPAGETVYFDLNVNPIVDDMLVHLIPV